MIYLDNAASTIIHQEVLDSMMPYLKEQYGNPSSIHRYGRNAERAIRDARMQIAGLVGAEPSEILLTSGGTESNNMALFGVANLNPGGHIVTTSIEHDAIMEPASRLESMGYDVTYLPVSDTGMVSPDDLKSALTDRTCLVSIMFANNEVGTIQPVQEIARICSSRNIPFHSDAVQAVGKVPIDVKSLGLDMMSISSHKINGPKGVGALYVRKGVSIDPMILGGGQEHGMRSGTENVAGLAGFGRACSMARQNIDANISHMRDLRDYLKSLVAERIPHSAYNGDSESRIPNNAHFTFLGVNGEDLIIKLDENSIAASTGSACSVKTQKASHVLKAMGFSHEQITGSLRLTVGPYNTRQEMDRTIDILQKVITELRSVSPYKEKYGF